MASGSGGLVRDSRAGSPLSRGMTPETHIGKISAYEMGGVVGYASRAVGAHRQPTHAASRQPSRPARRHCHPPSHRTRSPPTESTPQPRTAPGTTGPHRGTGPAIPPQINRVNTGAGMEGETTPCTAGMQKPRPPNRVTGASLLGRSADQRQRLIQRPHRQIPAPRHLTRRAATLQRRIDRRVPQIHQHADQDTALLTGQPAGDLRQRHRPRVPPGDGRGGRESREQRVEGVHVCLQSGREGCAVDAPTIGGRDFPLESRHRVTHSVSSTHDL